MTDTYRIVTAVRTTLAGPSDQMGRPMSLRVVFFVWLIALLASFFGAWYFDFGGPI